MKAEEAVTRYEALQEAVGSCGDGGCVILRQRGQHTNGGCRCLRHPDELTLIRARQMLMTAQEMASATRGLIAERAALRTLLATARAHMLGDGHGYDSEVITAIDAALKEPKP